MKKNKNDKLNFFSLFGKILSKSTAKREKSYLMAKIIKVAGIIIVLSPIAAFIALFAVLFSLSAIVNLEESLAFEE